MLTDESPSLRRHSSKSGAICQTIPTLPTHLFQPPVSPTRTTPQPALNRCRGSADVQRHDPPARGRRLPRGHASARVRVPHVYVAATSNAVSAASTGCRRIRRAVRCVRRPAGGPATESISRRQQQPQLFGFRRRSITARDHPQRRVGEYAALRNRSDGPGSCTATRCRRRTGPRAGRGVRSRRWVKRSQCGPPAERQIGACRRGAGGTRDDGTPRPVQVCTAIPAI